MGSLNGKRVAVLVEKLYEDLELWYPALRLKEAGCLSRLLDILVGSEECGSAEVIACLEEAGLGVRPL